MKKPVSDKSNKRKSSTAVTLVVIGAAAMATLTGCAKEDVRRDVYANKQDCLADWGNNAADCEPAYDHPASRGANTAYYGRPYIHNSGSTARSGRAIGSSSSASSRSGSSSSTSRGGFGSSGRSASSGG